MKDNKKIRILYASGLLCLCTSVVIWNFKLSDGAQGFLLGLGIVLTLYGFLSMKRKKRSYWPIFPLLKISRTNFTRKQLHDKEMPLLLCQETLMAQYLDWLMKLKDHFMRSILYIIAVVLVISWLLGAFVYGAGSIIHILLVLAIVSFLLSFIRRGTV